MNEKISALIDRQGNPRQRREAFDRLLADDGARRRRCRVWQRYHLIGCVLRGEVEQTGADLGERIRARLADEPTVLAPAARLASARTVARIVSWRSASWKSAGLLALAASVALAAVITLQPAGDEGAGGGVGNSIAGIADIADTADDHGVRFAQEVGEMLAQHGEFTSSPGLNGLVVYAKLVSNEPIER